MTYKFFNPLPFTLDEGKAMYRRLADQYHPDHGGSTEAMQAINAEWYDLRSRLPKYVSQQAREARQQRQQTAANVSAEVAQMLERLATLAGIKYDLVGSWIWCEPSARHKAALDKLGFRWSANRHMYYWHPADSVSGRARRKTYADIYNKYDCQHFQTRGQDELAS